MTSIANGDVDHIPRTYPEWRARIIQMHEEWQKKWVFDQTQGAPPTYVLSHKHSNIPPTFNVSSITSTPVLELTNRYAALSIKGMNNNNNNKPLKGSTNGLPARAEAKVVDPAGHKAESLSTLQDDGANRLTMTLITTASLTRPDEAGQQSESSPPGKAAPRVGNTARNPEDDNDMTPRVTPSPPTGAVQIVIPEETGKASNPAFAVQARSAVPQDGSSVTDLTHDASPRTSRQECPSKAAGDAKATAMKKEAAGQEAASTQAVNRGHPVSMIEVPDEEDDMAYQIWLTKKKVKESAPNKRVVLPTMTHQAPPKVEGWLRPFEVDWMLHADRLVELTDELLSELRKGGELAQERLYKLHEPPHYLRRRQSSDRDFTLDVQLNPCTGMQTLAVRGLLDSGCTSSLINCSFIQKHGLDMRKMAVPIAVHNADGTHNKAGDITEFMEF
ncbi:uncharacterized protein ARMOST_09945 [Armillaria ostoyae]|uniref:Uncharacterized protein n=1 Tax=Armillaria ostoyae TaxID=47428 RepID=A0A284RCX2_ARMOS|nr:uncharacterized protein ARMOST_09945 [Armillaria ostoyae]